MVTTAYTHVMCVYEDSYVIHSACVEAKWQLGAVSPLFHLYRTSKDQSRVARLVGQVHFPDEPSYCIPTYILEFKFHF